LTRGAVVCRSCGSDALEAFYEVRGIPVHSCLMVPTHEEALAFPRGDLRLDFCTACGFIQNSLFEPERLRYSTDYEETQAFSPRFRAFQTELCRSQVEKYALRGRTVLEIGCGKGDFLVELCELGDCHGIGIDPSYRPERISSPAAARIRFLQELYSQRHAGLTADYVCCRHTLEHIAPVHEFVRTVRDTLAGRPDATVFFELPDMERILLEQAFWDIYYEHCSYFTLGSLARLFRRCDFALLDLYKGFDGQYLMIESQPGAGSGARRFAAEEDLEKTAAQVKVFREQIDRKFASFRRQMEEIRAGSRTAVIWGSGSKAVSFLTSLQIGGEIEWIVDINPHKHGKFLAGSGHRIVAPAFLREVRPDVVIVMNPIYCDEIRADLAAMGLAPEVTAV
jgi:SAM-dependent methyltransferase